MSNPGSRAGQVAEAIHSAELEGLSVSTRTRGDADSYIAGDIDASGLVGLVRARYCQRPPCLRKPSSRAPSATSPGSAGAPRGAGRP
ncbi:hypothetical protein [Arthrobacter sp.]|uniref:antitoxin VbhA family protein n=1 Tax=Arthrobacter sp. TaxID=1667 RepID=UPI003A8CF22D